MDLYKVQIFTKFKYFCMPFSVCIRLKTFNLKQLSKYGLFSLYFIVLATGVVTAQLNIKVGYAGGAVQASQLDKIVDDFNTKFTILNPSGRLDDELDRISSLHGLEIGLRYRTGNLGFECTWNNFSNNSDVIGTLENQSSFQDKWFLSLTSYSAGVENYIGKFGFGASLAYRIFKMRTDISGATKKRKTITDADGFGTRIYLTFQFPGDKVGIAFKPFVELPLGSFDVTGFDQELGRQLNSSYQAEKNDVRLSLYGISIVLYNGLQ
jgi:hypothetical protein